jgi:hypothetical protein
MLEQYFERGHQDMAVFLLISNSAPILIRREMTFAVDTIPGFCKYGNETSNSVKGVNFLTR